MFSKEETQQLRHDFWAKLESKSCRVPGQNGKPIKWMKDKTGVKGLDLRFDVNRERVMVAIEISATPPERRQKIWEKLLSCKTLLEAKFGGPLTWDDAYVKEAGDTVCRVYTQTPGDIYDREKWSEMTRFMIDNMISLEKAYKVIQDFMSAN